MPPVHQGKQVKEPQKWKREGQSKEPTELPTEEQVRLTAALVGRNEWQRDVML